MIGGRRETRVFRRSCGWKASVLFLSSFFFFFFFFSHFFYPQRKMERGGLLLRTCWLPEYLGETEEGAQSAAPRVSDEGPALLSDLLPAFAFAFFRPHVLSRLSPPRSRFFQIGPRSADGKIRSTIIHELFFLFLSFFFYSRFFPN